MTDLSTHTVSRGDARLGVSGATADAITTVTTANHIYYYLVSSMSGDHVV